MPDRLELPDDELLNVNGGLDVLNKNKDSVSGHLSIEVNGWIIEKNTSTAEHCYQCTNIVNGLVFGIKYTKTAFNYSTDNNKQLGMIKNYVPTTKPTWIK